VVLPSSAKLRRISPDGMLPQGFTFIKYFSKIFNMIQSQKFAQSSGPVGEISLLERCKLLLFHRCFLVTFLVLIAFIVVLIFFAVEGRGVVPDPAKWQSVFLNNGQVYFGHLRKAQNDYVEIKNVYYLRAAQTLQPPASITPAPSFELVKLGGELHGPEDAIYLEKSSVLFWENMRGDSQVVQAINNFQKNLKQ
jgi:hypothetical protein